MKLTLPSYAVSAAFGRHVLSYAAGAITMAAAGHLITGDQATSLSGAVSQIAAGIQSIAGGVATLVSFGTAAYAAWSATRKSQMQAVANNPDVKQITVATSAVADSVTSTKVVSQ